ncbi:MAG: hypothetical protein H6728_08175 [Myxococcales bacterium]|nr:hypothetical protein [Myxococcales bacterium]MCB9643035.1 hypothetical protein [Myxococcales bacterium]
MNSMDFSYASQKTNARSFARMLVLLGAFLGGALFANNASALPVAVPSTYRVVGILQKTRHLALKHPAAYCLRDDGRLYRSVAFYVGGLKVHAPDPKAWLPFVGQMVVVEGTLHRDLNKILVAQGACPKDYGRQASMMQIRADWVGRETGFSVGRSSKKRLADVSYLSLRDVKPFSAIKLEKANGTGVSLSFRVSGASRTEKLMISAHYEGGRGKPTPYYIRTELHWDKGYPPRLQVGLPLQRSTAKGFAWHFGEDKVLRLDVPYRMSLARSRAARRSRFARPRFGFGLRGFRLVSPLVAGQLSYQVHLSVPR